MALVAWLAGCVAIWYLMPIVPRVVVPRSAAGEVLGFTDDGRGAYGFMFGSFDPPRDYYDRGVNGPNPNGPFRVWDVQTGRPLVTWKLPDSDYARRWLPAYPAAIVYSEDAMGIYLLDLRTGTREFLPDGLGRLADEPFILTPDGRYLGYLTEDDNNMRLHWYDRDAKMVVASFPAASPCTFHRDGRWSTVHKGAGTNGENVVLIREAVTGRELSRFQTKADVGLGEFSPDGRVFRTGGDGEISLINESGHCARIPAPFDLVHCYFVDATQVITEHVKSEVAWLNRWDAATGKHLGRYDPPTGFEFARHWDAARRHIVIASIDEAGIAANLPVWVLQLPGVDYLLQQDTRIYRVVDGLTERLLGEYRLTEPAHVEISPDGRTLVNVSTNGSLEFWDTPARKPLVRSAFAALVWALPVAWFARRHARLRTLAPGDGPPHSAGPL